MSAMENRTVMGIAAATAPSMMWAMSLMIPGRAPRIVKTETANKSRIMKLVNGIENYVGQDNKTPLAEIVDKCYALGDFPALWAIEGVGKDLAEWHMARSASPKDMLRPEMLRPGQEGAWLMLHAGIGMGFARAPIQKLPSNPSDAQVADFAQHAVELCRNNSMPGYAGAAIESIGLVSRFMRTPKFCQQIHAALARDPDASSYYWRGAGRCLYFHPANFPPGFSRPYHGPVMIEQEAPTPELKQGMLSGYAWALTVVNMTSPEVMEYVLGNVDELTTQPAFLNGITSSVVMRRDTTPGFSLPRDFMNHQPTDPKIADLWARKVRASVAFALDKAHPALAKAGRLEEVFHYQDLPALVSRLGSNVN